MFHAWVGNSSFIFHGPLAFFFRQKTHARKSSLAEREVIKWLPTLVCVVVVEFVVL